MLKISLRVSVISKYKSGSQSYLPHIPYIIEINWSLLSPIENGLNTEARSLYKYRNLNAMQTVGYSELFEHFDGTISLDKAIELIKRNTRRYAKRKLTWLRKYSDLNLMPNESISKMKGLIKNNFDN